MIKTAQVGDKIIIDAKNIKYKDKENAEIIWKSKK